MFIIMSFEFKSRFLSVFAKFVIFLIVSSMVPCFERFCLIVGIVIFLCCHVMIRLISKNIILSARFVYLIVVVKLFILYIFCVCRCNHRFGVVL